MILCTQSAVGSTHTWRLAVCSLMDTWDTWDQVKWSALHTCSSFRTRTDKLKHLIKIFLVWNNCLIICSVDRKKLTWEDWHLTEYTSKGGVLKPSYLHHSRLWAQLAGEAVTSHTLLRDWASFKLEAAGLWAAGHTQAYKATHITGSQHTNRHWQTHTHTYTQKFKHIYSVAYEAFMTPLPQPLPL